MREGGWLWCRYAFGLPLLKSATTSGKPRAGQAMGHPASAPPYYSNDPAQDTGPSFFSSQPAHFFRPHGPGAM